MNNSKRKLLLVAGGIAVASMAMSAALSPASAQKIRFMRVVPHPFPFLIPEIGVQEGIFKKHGLDPSGSPSHGEKPGSCSCFKCPD